MANSAALKESEKILERKLSEEVKRIGGLCIKLIPMHFVGLPDRMCLFKKGRIAFVELKSTGQKPRAIQVLVMNKISALGFDVRVIDTTEGIVKLISDYKDVK